MIAAGVTGIPTAVATLMTDAIQTSILHAYANGVLSMAKSSVCGMGIPGVVLAALLISLLGCAGPATRDDVALVSTVGERPATSVPPSRPMPPNPMALGSANAALTIIEFSDYQCPYCRRFHEQILPALRRTYIDTGKVQLIFKDFPLSMHPQAMAAALAGRCAAAQEKFWPMNALLFAHQDKLEAALYPRLAQTLALDVEAFKKCMRDPALREIVRRDQDQARSLNIDATPSFLIGRMQGERILVERVGRGFTDFATLSSEIDKLLADGASAK